MSRKFIYLTILVALLSGCDRGQVGGDVTRDIKLVQVQAILSEIKDGQARLIKAQLESNQLQSAQLAATLQNTQALLSAGGVESGEPRKNAH